MSDRCVGLASPRSLFVAACPIISRHCNKQSVYCSVLRRQSVRIFESVMVQVIVVFSSLLVAALACPNGWKESSEGCQLDSPEIVDTAEILDATEAVGPAVTEVLSPDGTLNLPTAEDVTDVDDSETTTMVLTEDEEMDPELEETDVGEEDGMDETETELDEGEEATEVEGRSRKTPMFEGDIRLTDTQRDFLMNVDMSENKKAKADLASRWPKGIVFYEFTPEVDSKMILQAMKHWEDNTCLRFYSYTNMEARRLAGHSRRMRFVKKNGCFSSVGMLPSGVNEISLGGSCVKFGTAVHEIGHALGLWHEQSRSDRDKFIRVQFENIVSGMEYNFQKYDTRAVNNYNVRYDVGSIMHYSSMGFSKNRKPTIVALDPSHQSKMGQRVALSPADIQIMRLMYNCPAQKTDECPETSSCLNGGVLTSKCTCTCGINFFGERCERVRHKCGGVISGLTSGVIESPKYLSRHHPSQQCDWTILARPSDVIRLTVEHFNVGHKDKCQRRWVTIDDGDTPLTLCGSKDDIPNEFQSSIGKLIISFGEMSSRRKSRFRFRFNVERAEPAAPSGLIMMEGLLRRPHSAKCGDTIQARTNGVITSPNYPKPYDNNLDCTWLIEAPSGGRIRLMRNDFDVEYSPTCEWDYVTMSGAFVMNRFCGQANNFLNDVLSSGNQLLIKFKTDSSKALKGFKLSYYVV